MSRRSTLSRAPHDAIDAGFTLVEIMVVVIILGILAATIIPQFVGVTLDAKISSTKGVIAALEKQLEVYYLHLDRYPSTEEGLRALVEQPAGASGWKGPYIKELKPDPWGNPYRYVCPGQRNRTYDLWSTGADGVDGGEGPDADVTNWTTSSSGAAAARDS